MSELCGVAVGSFPVQKLAPVQGQEFKKVRREYFSHPTIKRAQKIHFYLLDVVPLIVLFASLPVFIQFGIPWYDLFLFFFIYFLTVIGIEIGYHRYFSHMAFDASPGTKIFLNILGAMAGEGPAIAWVSNHRHHHKYSDQDGDSHSPHTGQSSRLRKFFHSHLLWKYQYSYPNPGYYAPALVKDKIFSRVDRLYYFWVLVGVLLPGIIVGLLTQSGFQALRSILFAGVARLIFGQHMTWCINSICHLFGTREFETTDRSRNISVLSLITLGGSLHNNHHAFMNSATNSYRPGHLDPSFWIIRGLSLFGFVSELKVPSLDVIEKKRLK